MQVYAFNTLIPFYTETKRSHRDESDKRERKKRSKSNKTGDQFVTEEDRERAQLMTNTIVSMEVLNTGEGEKMTKHVRNNLFIYFQCREQKIRDDKKTNNV